MTKTNQAAPTISSNTVKLLSHIEEVLNLSAGTFLFPGFENDEHYQILSEAPEMINVFVRISDDEMRQRCVEFVRAAYKMTSPK